MNEGANRGSTSSCRALEADLNRRNRSDNQELRPLGRSPAGRCREVVLAQAIRGLLQTEIAGDNPCYRQLSGGRRKMRGKRLTPRPSS